MIITISTLGNAQDFGDLLIQSTQCCREHLASRSQEDYFWWISLSGNIIEFLPFASTGDATDFGDLLQSK